MSGTGKQIRAVLWDMDGTLVDSEPLHELSFIRAFADCGIDVPEGFHSAVVGRAEAENYEWIRQRTGLGLGYEEWRTLRYRHYMDLVGDLRPVEASYRLWRSNQQRGIQQAIVSNSDRMLMDANLAATGLARPGIVTVTRNDVVKGKPDPEPYLRAAMLLGIPPQEIAVVEDSSSGVLAGVGAGMATYYLPVLLESPCAEARPFAELVQLLEEVKA
jgi:beta-phosphoglucomutase-like phosphatase (HAD superfamily)